MALPFEAVIVILSIPVIISLMALAIIYGARGAQNSRPPFKKGAYPATSYDMHSFDTGSCDFSTSTADTAWDNSCSFDSDSGTDSC